MKLRLIISAFIVFSAATVLAQKTSKIADTSQTLMTYPYFNPNYVPESGSIYPYYRFDGYSVQGKAQAWKMVEMENDYIRLWITPEIGGKIWGAMDKESGKEFIYFNHAVKFRDVAMRGPWTSGGLELNFGVIGHAPTCSSPVDYFTRVNGDSSVSCFIGALDLSSRTEWRVEVRLPKDNAGFITKAIWYNGSPYEQSYYQWMNVGVKTSGNLEYAYPGKYYLGHDGRHFSFPVDEQGRNISLYNHNDFGPAKSYHVSGSYTDFFGGYWHDDEFGFGHYAEYGDKPGKKIWIWGLARDGMIWENLLTDADGQYTEIQSGRLFNQSAESSSETPFKHRSFIPYTSDCWTEYWFPVKGTKGIMYATASLTFNIKKENEETNLFLYASRPVDNRLRVVNDNMVVIDQPLKMDPEDLKHLRLPSDTGKITVLLGDETIYSSDIQDKKLNRPVELPAGFDFKTVYGLFLQGKEWERQRNFEKAKASYSECLKKDSYYVPALGSLAGIHIREMRPVEAIQLTKIALAVDTYDPVSNYNYGLANSMLGNKADALDGFSIAGQSPEYRVAAFTQLAMHYIKEGALDKAGEYLSRSLLSNQHNLQALQMLATIGRLQKNTQRAEKYINMILWSDPLNHYARFEKYLLNSDARDAQEFKKYIRNEMAHETYLELAIKYFNINQYTTALKVLEMAPGQAMVQVWKAYLTSKNGQTAEAQSMLAQAADLSTELVFPFRQEDASALQWAVKQNDSWKFKYYLALVLANLAHQDEALALLNQCGEVPKFFPFYSTRAGLQTDAAAKEKDLIKADEITTDWRPMLTLAKYYADNNSWDKATSLVEPYFKKYPEIYYVGLFLARCYLNLGRFNDGIVLMTNLKVLPNEGASEGRETWRETNLQTAMSEIGKGNYTKALKWLEAAKQWPENLGVGRPYDVDERLEDYLIALCYEKTSQADKSSQQLQKVEAPVLSEGYKASGPSDLLSAEALRKSGKKGEADKLMQNWLQQSPNDKIARWSTAIYFGRSSETLNIPSEASVPAEEPEAETRIKDHEFQFLVKYSKILFP